VRNSPMHSTSIVRSLRAGPSGADPPSQWWRREMADPIGSEFGIVADEITYGADLENRHAQSVFSASARTTCRCSGHRGGDPEARPAAISAKFWKTSPP